MGPYITLHYSPQVYPRAQAGHPRCPLWTNIKSDDRCALAYHLTTSLTTHLPVSPGRASTTPIVREHEVRQQARLAYYLTASLTPNVPASPAGHPRRPLWTNIKSNDRCALAYHLTTSLTTHLPVSPGWASTTPTVDEHEVRSQVHPRLSSIPISLYGHPRRPPCTDSKSILRCAWALISLFTFSFLYMHEHQVQSRCDISYHQHPPIPLWASTMPTACGHQVRPQVRYQLNLIIYPTPYRPGHPRCPPCTDDKFNLRCAWATISLFTFTILCRPGRP